MSKKKVSLVIAMFTVLLTVSLVAYGSELDMFVGEWSGAIDIPGQPLEIDVRLKLSGESLAGEMDIPIQGALDIPLKDFQVGDKQIAFTLFGIPGDPAVVAVLSEDLHLLDGQFTQAGMSFPVSLERQERTAESPAQEERTLSEIQEDLRCFIEGMVVEWDVPGAAVGVIYQGEVLLADGFGFRDLENNLPVTENTLFAIGSATKAFTAASAELMVSEGKLSWDTPIIEYLPWFRMYDDEVTRNITLRDFGTHSSGLPRHDLAWYGNEIEREKYVRMLRYLEPSIGFRQGFQYNNFGYTTIGYITGEVAGTEWEQLVQERLLDPLGMDQTNFSVSVSQTQDDFALPYNKSDGEVQLMEWRSLDGMGPAGSINSSVNDMLKWVSLFLNGGTVGEQQILSPAAIAEMTSSQLALPVGGYPEVRFSNYGLGWMIEDYRGDLFIQHGGNIDGFSALVAMVPNKHIGIVVLTNMNNSGLPLVVAYQVIDELSNRDPVNWSARLRPTYDLVSEQEMMQPPRQVEGTQPSRDLSLYTGYYEHPAYGQVVVSLDSAGEQLWLEFREVKAPLRHWHYDVFASRLLDFLTGLDLPVQFLSNLEGQIQALEIPLEVSVDPIRFQLIPDPAKNSPEYLEQFLGVYEVLGIPMTVRMRDHGLLLEIPGQGSMELLPERGLRFVVEDLSGYSVEFIKQEGKIIGLYLNQPNGTFEGTKIE